jgi:hypothetical protein
MKLKKNIKCYILYVRYLNLFERLIRNYKKTKIKRINLENMKKYKSLFFNIYLNDKERKVYLDNGKEEITVLEKENNL